MRESCAENDVLFPRLQRRGYSEKKIAENVDCEIMCVVAEEARESYKEEIIWELQSNTIAELDANVQREMRPFPPMPDAMLTVGVAGLSHT